MTWETQLYRYLGLANYEDRFVIPGSHREYAGATFDAYSERDGCGFSFGNGCSTGTSGGNLFGGKKPSPLHAIPVKVEPRK